MAGSRFELPVHRHPDVWGDVRGRSRSLVQVDPTFVNAQVGVQFGFLMNESLVTRARNALVWEFLQSDATHLMFIDSDIGFRRKHPAHDQCQQGHHLRPVSPQVMSSSILEATR